MDGEKARERVGKKFFYFFFFLLHNNKDDNGEWSIVERVVCWFDRDFGASCFHWLVLVALIDDWLIDWEAQKRSKKEIQEREREKKSIRCWHFMSKRKQELTTLTTHSLSSLSVVTYFTINQLTLANGGPRQAGQILPDRKTLMLVVVVTWFDWLSGHKFTTDSLFRSNCFLLRPVHPFCSSFIYTLVNLFTIRFMTALVCFLGRVVSRKREVMPKEEETGKSDWLTPVSLLMLLEWSGTRLPNASFQRLASTVFIWFGCLFFSVFEFSECCSRFLYRVSGDTRASASNRKNKTEKQRKTYNRLSQLVHDL